MLNIFSHSQTSELILDGLALTNTRLIIFVTQYILLLLLLLFLFLLFKKLEEGNKTIYEDAAKGTQIMTWQTLKVFLTKLSLPTCSIPCVNFIIILRVPFWPIFLRKKIQSQNVTWKNHFSTKKLCVKCWWNWLHTW